MRRCLYVGVFTVACIALIGQSNAESYSIVGVQFDGTTSGIVRGLSLGESVYMGPYGMKVPYPPTSTLESLWMCFDATASITSGETWTALQTDTAGLVSLGWYSSDINKINEIAWLTTQEAGKSASALADISEAVWQIMNGVTDTDPVIAKRVSSNWVILAESHAKQFTDAKFLLPVELTPNGSGHCVTDGGNTYCQDMTSDRPQPFIQPVPEPSTLLLLGSGLLGGVVFARRFRK